MVMALLFARYPKATVLETLLTVAFAAWVTFYFPIKMGLWIRSLIKRRVLKNGK